MALIDTPGWFAVLTFLVMWSAAHLGIYFRKSKVASEANEPEQFGVIVGAALTLLGLLIGFSFSMAVSRYDQRENYEEQEANAIGTAYVRAGLLPDAESARLRARLRSYLDQRLLFYVTRDDQRLEQIEAATVHLQEELWSTVQDRGSADPTPITALVVAGMNDVLNAQGYTQAAWWNRIPKEAWALMVTIGTCCNLLLGYSTRRPEIKAKHFFFILPAIVAVSFFLIAELDNPRHGVIKVNPLNLLSLSQALSGSAAADRPH